MGVLFSASLEVIKSIYDIFCLCFGAKGHRGYSLIKYCINAQFLGLLTVFSKKCAAVEREKLELQRVL
jgi:hypothetical protein